MSTQQTNRATASVTYRVEKAAPEIYPLVTRFYSQARYKSKPGRLDEVWLVRSYSEQEASPGIVAAVRLCPIQEGLFLRSLVVLPELRRQGLASQLMTEVCREMTSLCWCFPYLHLVSFYDQFGFRLASVDQSPVNLAQKHAAYQGQGKKLAIMHREP